MKLHDWAVQSALAAGDRLGAINAVCDIFGMPRFAADSPAILSLNIHDTGIDFEQIRIAYAGCIYIWQPGRHFMRTSHLNGDWITMWVCSDRVSK